VEKKIGFVVLSVVLLLGGCASTTEKSNGTDNGEKMVFIESQLVSLGKLVEQHKEIKDIDKSLEKLQTVAIVKDNVYFVFGPDQSGENYEFKMEYPVEMKIPDGVRATFPLGFYDGKAAAVITEDAFETREDIVVIFHEFVHCFQTNETGKLELRQILTVAQEAEEKRDIQWELNYPFPYTSEFFVSKTEALDAGYDIVNYHTEMKAELDQKDFEYMIWQEFAEGHANYIENLIRERWRLNKIGFPLTLQGYLQYRENLMIEMLGDSDIPLPQLPQSFERIVFYEIGKRYIDALIQSDPGLKDNIKALFYKMVNLEI
jgi:hypothetical protein